MMTPPDVQFQRQAQECYSEGYAVHGDLDLEFEEYRLRLAFVVHKHLESGVAEDGACAFLKTLCTTHLYLSTACAKPSEPAWDRFAASYTRLILLFARSFCHNEDSAAEVADGVLANMFIPDDSGRSRIASYAGRGPLSGWLRVTVINYASKECERKCNNLESLDSLEQMADETGLSRFESSLRSRKYGTAIREALAFAVRSLSSIERAILLLRYEEELQVAQIARAMQVNPSSITRRIQGIQRRFREQFIASLSERGFAEATIEECTQEVLENSAYSILALTGRAH